jgi:hypothetical protein
MAGDGQMCPDDLEALLVLADIGSERTHGAAREFLGQLIAHLFEVCLVARHKQHIRTEAGQFANGSQADATTCAGHQGQLSIESPARSVHRRIGSACPGRVGAADSGSALRLPASIEVAMVRQTLQLTAGLLAASLLLACSSHGSDADEVQTDASGDQPAAAEVRQPTVLDDQPRRSTRPGSRGNPEEGTGRSRQADRRTERRLIAAVIARFRSSGFLLKVNKRQAMTPKRLRQPSASRLGAHDLLDERLSAIPSGSAPAGFSSTRRNMGDDTEAVAAEIVQTQRAFEFALAEQRVGSDAGQTSGPGRQPRRCC